MATKTVTTAENIMSRKASYVPGDDLRELTAPMRDVDGHLWMAGTKFRPFYAGYNNVSGQTERTITLIGVPDED